MLVKNAKNVREVLFWIFLSVISAYACLHYVHKTRHILLEITDDCIKIHTPATLLGIPRTGLDPLFLPSELP